VSLFGHGNELHRAGFSLGESLRGVVRLRDELLSVEQFDTLLEAQVLVGDWKHEYNTYRPHSSLGWRCPVAYATAWKTENQVDRLSQTVDL